ncbi:hypothetical protein MMC20_001777 [Loxospora ochrophaea]|nr:hypothetical protein [Loxospora ochrophaea]
MDRILYSVDYPFEDLEDGADFIYKLAESGLVSEKDVKMIAYENAEELLKIPVGAAVE